MNTVGNRWIVEQLPVPESSPTVPAKRSLMPMPAKRSLAPLDGTSVTKRQSSSPTYGGSGVSIGILDVVMANNSLMVLLEEGMHIQFEIFFFKMKDRTVSCDPFLFISLHRRQHLSSKSGLELVPSICSMSLSLLISHINLTFADRNQTTIRPQADHNLTTQFSE
jgi:hypothetical protein